MRWPISSRRSRADKREAPTLRVRNFAGGEIASALLEGVVVDRQDYESAAHPYSLEVPPDAAGSPNRIY
jgi:hypothetical protein